MGPARAPAAVICMLAAVSAPARADPPPPAPTASRVVHAPTAWLQPAGQLQVQLSASHRLAPAASAALGLGDLAELDVELTDRFIACPGCPGADGERAETNLAAGTAAFRMGHASARGRRIRAGVVLGFRKSFAGRTVVAGGRDAPLESAALHLVGGLRLGGLELHGGAELHDARHGTARMPRAGTAALRPLAAIAWTPPPYPRTTLLVDVAWLPEVKDAGPRVHWLLGWGVRYQALSWGAIDLVVRQREDQALGDATVFVRVTGDFSLR